MPRGRGAGMNVNGQCGLGPRGDLGGTFLTAVATHDKAFEEVPPGPPLLPSARLREGRPIGQVGRCASGAVPTPRSLRRTRRAPRLSGTDPRFTKNSRQCARTSRPSVRLSGLAYMCDRSVPPPAGPALPPSKAYESVTHHGTRARLCQHRRVASPELEGLVTRWLCRHLMAGGPSAREAGRPTEKGRGEGQGAVAVRGA